MYNKLRFGISLEFRYIQGNLVFIDTEIIFSYSLLLFTNLIVNSILIDAYNINNSIILQNITQSNSYDSFKLYSHSVQLFF